MRVMVNKRPEAIARKTDFAGLLDRVDLRTAGRHLTGPAAHEAPELAEVAVRERAGPPDPEQAGVVTDGGELARHPQDLGFFGIPQRDHCFGHRGRAKVLVIDDDLISELRGGIESLAGDPPALVQSFEAVCVEVGGAPAHHEAAELAEVVAREGARPPDPEEAGVAVDGRELAPDLEDLGFGDAILNDFRGLQYCRGVHRAASPAFLACAWAKKYPRVNPASSRGRFALGMPSPFFRGGTMTSTPL